MNFNDKTKEELIEEIQILKDENNKLRSLNTIYNHESEGIIDYQNLFDTMLNGFALQKIITDDNGNPINFLYLAVNEAFGKQTGMDINGLVGKTILDVLPEVEKEWIEKYGNVALTGEPMRFTQYASPLNKYFDVYVFSPKKEYFAILFNDVTEHQALLNKVTVTEKKYKHLFSSAPDAIIVVDPDTGFILNANDSAAQLWKRPIEELIGMHQSQLHPKEAQSIAAEDFESLKFQEAHEMTPIELPIISSAGDTIPIEVIKRKLDYDGKPALLGYFRNLTERKRAEQELEESELLLRETGKLAKVGGWKILNDRLRVYISDTSMEIFELDKRELSIEEISSFFKTSHRKFINDSFKNLIDNNEKFDLILQFKNNTTSQKWIRIIGKSESINDKRTKFHGTIQDITEQVLVQEQLITEREQLDITLKSIGDGVITTDKQGNVVLLNKIAEKLSGWKTKDAYGKPFTEVFKIINDTTGKEAKNPIEVVLKYNKAVGLEDYTKLISKDGSEYIIADSASPIQNIKGEVVGVVLVFRDITESKRAQDKILNKSKLLNLANKIFEDSVRDVRLKELAGTFLDSAMELTSATIGFVGEINKNERFDTLDFRGYDPLSHGLTGSELKKILTNVKIRGLRGYVYESKTGFYTNQPQQHPKSSGVPKWHTELSSFLGYPLIDKEKVIGIIGIANKDGGFNDTDLENLKYLSYTFTACYNRKKIEIDLLESEERYRTLIEIAPVPMIIHDEDKLLYCNSESVSILKAKTQEEILSKSLWDIVPAENHPQVKDRIRELSTSDGTSDLYEERVICMKSNIIDIEIRGTKIEYMGKSAFLIAFQDITDRKKFNDQLKESERKLKDAILSKDKFFDIIAHDLRSPILGFLGLSESISKNFYHISMSEMQEMSNALYRSSFNLNRLLENLLEWSRTQTGKIQPELIYHDIYDSVAECYELNSTTAEKKQIKLVNNIASNTQVYADKKMVYTVIRNLVNNAVKFTNSGGEIKISSQKVQKMIEISVSDTGVGIPKEHIEKLFRIDDTYTSLGTENEKGTGLGLILCKEFIRINGGDIWLESEEGKGSTFTFSLPILQPK